MEKQPRFFVVTKKPLSEEEALPKLTHQAWIQVEQLRLLHSELHQQPLGKIQKVVQKRPLADFAR
jgi:hypothetical protein